MIEERMAELEKSLELMKIRLSAVEDALEIFATQGQLTGEQPEVDPLEAHHQRFAEEIRGRRA